MTKNQLYWMGRTPKGFRGKHKDWYWVDIDIPLTKKEMAKVFGRKCSTFDRDCACCKAWRSWERTGRARVVMEREECLGLESTSSGKLLIELYNAVARTMRGGNKYRLPMGVRKAAEKVKRSLL